MGIDISSKLIVGRPYTEVVGHYEFIMDDEDMEELKESLDDALDCGELDYASPYYDSPRTSWIVGVELWIDGDSVDDARMCMVSAAEDFEAEWGIPAKVYVSPHVY